MILEPAQAGAIVRARQFDRAMIHIREPVIFVCGYYYDPGRGAIADSRLCGFARDALGASIRGHCP